MALLRAALLGVNGVGQLWLDALKDHARFELVAVADQTLEAAEAAAEPIGAAAYDDYRQALVENRIDAAVVALPAFAAEPYLAVAAERRIAVLKETPLARSFEEAVRAVGLFYSADVPFVVASRWRFDEGLTSTLTSSTELGSVQLAHAHVVSDVGSPFVWRGDLQRAGGGALLDAGYDAADLLVSMLGVPGDVLSQFGRLAPMAGERFDAEDTAAVLMRYSKGVAATLSAAWRVGMSAFDLQLLGTAGHAVLTRTAAFISANSGADVTIRRPGESESLRIMLDRFADAMETGVDAYPGRAADQLATAAFLDAAYLSSRTHAVESPARAYELAGLPMPRVAAPRVAPAI